MNKKLYSLHASAMAAALGTIVTATQPTFAVCNQTSASVSDTDFFNARESSTIEEYHCRSAFNDLHLPVLMNMGGKQEVWYNKNHRFSGTSWRDGGENDRCNINKEWAKFANAVQLILAAPQLADFTADDRPFHDAWEYFSLVYALESDWHDIYVSSVEDDIGSASAQFRSWFGYEYYVISSCKVFDSSVSSRAATLIHEAWHAWQTKHENESRHDADSDPKGDDYQPRGIGLCKPGQACDWFHEHEKSAFGKGDLIKGGHMPYQIQYEFLCDIAEYGADWLPASVREAAAMQAKRQYKHTFANYPAPYCGSGRPYWTKDKAAAALNGKPECQYAKSLADPVDCSGTGSCGSGETCDDDGCCRLTCLGSTRCTPDADWLTTGINEAYCTTGSACNMEDLCCGGNPQNCPPLMEYDLANGMGGHSDVRSITLRNYDDAKCHYIGTKVIDSIGGGSTGHSEEPGYRFSLNRLNACPDASQQCVPQGAFAPLYQCDCDEATGCCRPQCPDVARQCNVGSSCTTGACDAQGCCPAPTADTCPLLDTYFIGGRDGAREFRAVTLASVGDTQCTYNATCIDIPTGAGASPPFPCTFTRPRLSTCLTAGKQCQPVLNGDWTCATGSCNLATGCCP